MEVTGAQLSPGEAPPNYYLQRMDDGRAERTPPKRAIPDQSLEYLARRAAQQRPAPDARSTNQRHL